MLCGALTDVDLFSVTDTQLLPGVWTITEVSVGIICGNLPLLRPLFLGFFKSTNFKPQSRQQAQYSFHNTTGTVGTKTGFERMPDNRSGDIESNYDHTDLELKGLARYGASHGMQQHLDPELGKIRVQTEVLVRTDENNQPPPRAW